MSQNKFMHPRNIYKKPPNFKEMAIRFPEFRKFAKPDISGKITLDFKDPESLRALTMTLLKKDFDLQVDIPLTRLIPTLPLRLNYLLWIEDLLDVAGIQRSNYTSVHGIDIGTGASCIYPLLAAKQNGWCMTATEIDNESFGMAKKNVNNNNLQNLVTVKFVEGSTLLTDVVQNDVNYTFSMCNPPFFSTEQDLDYTTKSRSPNRPPPNNGTTGDLKELVAPGGEVAFILKMMEESKVLRNKVRIFTSMIGQKTSMTVLKLELGKLNVASMSETRFCQGNTTRWGIAWTYNESFSLQKAYQTPSQKKSNTVMSYVVPLEAVNDETMYTVDIISGRVTDLLSALQVKYKLRKKNKFMAMFDVTAFKNTWSHQRKRKRQLKLNELASKIVECDISKDEEEEVNLQYSKENSSVSKRFLSDFEQDEIVPKKLRIEEIVESTALPLEVPPSSVTQIESNPFASHAEKPTDGEPCKQTNAKSCIALLEATVFVRSLASEIHIEFLWKGGTGGRECMHQVLQYIKNKLK